MTSHEPATELKTCNRCHQQLPVSAFNANPNFRDGLHGQCRECQEAVIRECEAIVASRIQKISEKQENLSAEERERLRQRNLQYRRKYLEKKRDLGEPRTKRTR